MRTTTIKAGSTGILAVAMAFTVSLTGTGAATAAPVATAPASQAAPAAATTASAAASHGRLGTLETRVKGVAENGRKVRGTFTPTEFSVVDGVLQVTGDLEGRFVGGKPRAFAQEVTTPVQAVDGQQLAAPAARGMSAATGAAPGVAAAPPGSCDILNLDLGPLNLDILGLQVNLQRVVLDIVAQTGAGNLLGNLLCAVAGLLDGGPLAGLLDQLATLLNQILAVLGR